MQQVCTCFSPFEFFALLTHELSRRMDLIFRPDCFYYASRSRRNALQRYIMWIQRMCVWSLFTYVCMYVCLQKRYILCVTTKTLCISECRRVATRNIHTTHVYTHTLVHNVLPWRHDENRRISPAALPKRIVTFISRVHINIVGPLYYLDPIGSPLAPRKYSWKSRFLSGAPPPPENTANCCEYTRLFVRGGEAVQKTHTIFVFTGERRERERESENINFKRASSTREMSPEYSPRYTYIYTAGPWCDCSMCVIYIYTYTDVYV